MPTKRDIVELLKRHELAEISESFDLNPPDWVHKDGLVETVSSSRRATLDKFLSLLKRDRLKELCREFDLDDSGRSKDEIANRLIKGGATSKSRSRKKRTPLPMPPSPVQPQGSGRISRSKARKKKRKSMPMPPSPVQQPQGSRRTTNSSSSTSRKQRRKPPARRQKVGKMELGDGADEHPSWLRQSSFSVPPRGALPVPDIVRDESELFEHQQEAVDKLIAWNEDKENKSGILVLPTGAGKTRIAVTFALRECIPDKRVLWLAHREELLDQALTTFLKLSGNASRPFDLAQFRQGAKHEDEADLFVGSIDMIKFEVGGRLKNLDRLLDASGGFDLVVVDECHHAPAGGWYRLLTELKNRCRRAPRLLGLTATPTRNVDREKGRLWSMFDWKTIHEVPVPEMIKRGVLARPALTPVDTEREFEADEKEKKHFDNFKDIPPSLANKIAADEARNNLVLNTYLEKKKEWGSSLLFAQNIEQARHLAGQLRSNGVAAVEVFGSTEKEERKQATEDFRKGKLDVLVNCQLFTEGTDIPGVHSVFLARPTRSQTLFSQMVGRGMRGPEIGGTKQCNVVTFNDSISGLMDDYLKKPWSDEAALFRSIGLPVPEEPQHEEIELDKESRERAAIPDARQEQIGHLVQLLRDLNSGVVDEIPEQVPLVGWWWCEMHGTRRYLPIFRQESDLIQEWMSKVIIALGYRDPNVSLKGLDDLIWTSKQSCKNFADMAVKANQIDNSTPSYVNLADLLTRPDDDENYLKWASDQAREMAQALESTKDITHDAIEQSMHIAPSSSSPIGSIQQEMQNPRWELVIPLSRLGYSVAYADGELHKAEVRSIEEGVIRFDPPLGQEASRGGAKRLINVELNTKMDVSSASDEILEVLNENERITCFDFALDVAIADGKLRPEEVDALEMIGKKLEVPLDTVYGRLERYAHLEVGVVKKSNPDHVLCPKCGRRWPESYKFCPDCAGFLGVDGSSDVEMASNNSTGNRLPK